MLKFVVEIDESKIYLNSFNDFFYDVISPYHNTGESIIKTLFLFTLYPIVIIISLVIALIHYLFLGIFKLFSLLYEFITEDIFYFPNTEHFSTGIILTISVLLFPFRLLLLIMGWTFISGIAIASYFILIITSIFMFLFSAIGYSF